MQSAEEKVFAEIGHESIVLLQAKIIAAATRGPRVRIHLCIDAFF